MNIKESYAISHDLGDVRFFWSFGHRSGAMSLIIAFLFDKLGQQVCLANNLDNVISNSELLSS